MSGAAAALGNVPLVVRTVGLDRDCPINVSQLMSVNRVDLAGSVGVLDSRTIRRVDDWVRLVLSLG